MQRLLSLVLLLCLSSQSVLSDELFLLSTPQMRVERHTQDTTDSTNTISIITKNPVSNTKTVQLSAPPRFVVDLFGVSVLNNFTVRSHLPESLRAIRIGRHPNRIRLVFDLSSDEIHGAITKRDERTFEVTVTGVGAQSPENINMPARSSAPSPKRQQTAVVSPEPAPPALTPLAPPPTSHLPAVPLPQPSLQISDVTVRLDVKNAPVRNINVRNTLDQAVIVSSSVAALFPGASETSVEVLASPRKMALQPNEQRAFRLIATGSPPKTEHGVEVIFSIEPKREAPSTDSPPQEAIRIVALVAPDRSVTKLSQHREQDHLLLMNEGTVSLLIDNGSICSPLTKCEAVPTQRIWPGQQVAFRTTDAGAIAFLLGGPDGFEPYRFSWGEE